MLFCTRRRLCTAVAAAAHVREIGLLCDSRLESVSRRLPSHWQKIHFAMRCLRLHWRMCVLLHHRSEASSTALSQNISALLSLRRSCVRPILDCIRVRTSCCGCMRWLRQPAQQVALLRPVFRIHTDSSSELLYKSSSRKAVSSHGTGVGLSTPRGGL